MNVFVFLVPVLLCQIRSGGEYGRRSPPNNRALQANARGAAQEDLFGKLIQNLELLYRLSSIVCVPEPDRHPGPAAPLALQQLLGAASHLDSCDVSDGDCRTP